LGLGGKARNLSDSLTARLQSFKTGYHAGISDAVSYVSAGHPRQAIAILEPLLAGHPDDEALLNNLSVAYTHLGEQQRQAGDFESGERYTRKAREVLLKVVVLDPTGFPAYINLAVAELALGMNADALRHAEAAVRYAPDVARTRFVRGQAYMRYRRWQEAYADLKKAIQIEGDKADQHAILGEICQALGKHAEAIQEFETALRFDDPSVQLAWLGIGFSAALIGDFEKAATAYEEARTTIGANDPRVQRLQQVIRGR
jgi:tetratricopeptide (TPR) repeat protein